MYEKMNASRDSEGETKDKHVGRKKLSETRKRKPKQIQKGRLYQMRRTELEQTT